MQLSKSFVVAVALPLLMSGCASIPMASKEQDAAAKSFHAPPDQGRIYVYRNEFFGGAVKIPITLDGKLAGSTLKNTLLCFRREPWSPAGRLRRRIVSSKITSMSVPGNLHTCGKK